MFWIVCGAWFVISRKGVDRKYTRLSLDVAPEQTSTHEFARGTLNSGLKRTSDRLFAQGVGDIGLERSTNPSVHSRGAQ